jgi:hypothetical protein
MIISHQHKFIFIKTKKTAGTSIEIALSKICGDRDVITPITPEDEVTRRTLGYRGPQNCVVNGAEVFYNHISARDVRALVGNDVWGTYFKFCFERNPWDKVISWYFFSYQVEPRPSISEFIRYGHAGLVGGPGGYDLYTIDGNVAVDRVCLYEDIEAELLRVQHQLGLPEIPTLPKAKSRFRQDKRHYRDILGAEDKIEIERIFAREIALFGFRYQTS